MYISTQNYLFKVVSSSNNKMGRSQDLSLLIEWHLVMKIHMDKMNVS